MTALSLLCLWKKIGSFGGSDERAHNLTPSPSNPFSKTSRFKGDFRRGLFDTALQEGALELSRREQKHQKGGGAVFGRRHLVDHEMSVQPLQTVGKLSVPPIRSTALTLSEIRRLVDVFVGGEYELGKMAPTKNHQEVEELQKLWRCVGCMGRCVSLEKPF